MTNAGTGGWGREEKRVWFRQRGWIPVAWILSGINIAAIYFAAMPGEPLHATTHGLLAVLFGLGARHLQQRHQRAEEAYRADDEIVERVQELESRLADVHQLPNPANRISELEERLDFMERVLVEVRAKGQVPPKE